MDVAGPSKHISLDDMNRLVDDAKSHGNSYFGILGGEPFLHPQLMEIFRSASGLLLSGLHERPADHRRGGGGCGRSATSRR